MTGDTTFGMAPADARLAALIRAQCRVLRPPTCPELSYWGADDSSPLWNATQPVLDALGLAAPFWAFAWAGGQALARYILDHPDAVAGRRVAVLASGAGLEAIAAARSGAAEVLAIDLDPAARAAAEMNAALNGVRLEAEQGDAFSPASAARWRRRADLLLIGDAFYEAALSDAIGAVLAPALAQGIEALVGDPGRGYAPTLDAAVRAEAIAAISVPTPHDLEGVPAMTAQVLRLSNGLVAKGARMAV